jgi:predicted esterase
MNHPTQEILELAKANISIAIQHMDHDSSVAFQHVERAMKELKEAEYKLWHQTHTSGVLSKVKAA